MHLPLNTIYLLKMFDDLLVQDLSEERWHSVSDLLSNRAAVEYMIIWERLQSSQLTTGKAPQAAWVTVLTTVASDTLCETVGVPRLLEGSVGKQALRVVVRSIGRNGAQNLSYGLERLESIMEIIGVGISWQLGQGLSWAVGC